MKTRNGTNIRVNQGDGRKELEHFQKYCSHSEPGGTLVFLGFGVVSAQSQGHLDLLLYRILAKTQKSSPRMATEFLQTLYDWLWVVKGVSR